MLRTRKRAKRRRVSFARSLRELGVSARTAYRHGRVWLWRFRRSPEQQDRAAAIATFAFIGMFALGSVDAIVTGGADFGPGAAYAMPYEPARHPTAPPVSTIMVEPPPPTAELATENVDYSFTTEELLGGPEPEAAAAKPGAEALTPAAAPAAKAVL